MVGHPEVGLRPLGRPQLTGCPWLGRNPDSNEFSLLEQAWLTPLPVKWIVQVSSKPTYQYLAGPVLASPIPVVFRRTQSAQ